MSSESKNNTRKIGARLLNEEEIISILPTYPQIDKQIEFVRENIKSLNKNDTGIDLTKITNSINIGILGARGTGKTSVIKTLMKDLEEDKNKENNKKRRNILLPLIVPENMSESSNLMATILGVFKSEIDKLKHKYNKGTSRECFMQNSHEELLKTYNNLIKKYCYIQNEYRQIIVGEYTTENEYVKRSSEIFNSDIEFLKCLNEFITDLLGLDEYEKDEALIFIFIDDIDLSTQRCTDIVKTLLSYLTHPRIVTIISGDLYTFEEALTLDFIREERITDADFLDKSFVTKEDGGLLKRKQELAYEYLKKILPPAYRHSVKYWSLSDRGNYIIKENDKSLTLAGLLTDIFNKDYNCGDFFQYCDYSEESKENVKNLPQVYNIFDDTSRGLNNVYNVLLDIQDIIKDENRDEKDKISAIKLLLETIISSNKELNQYYGDIFKSAIRFGTDFKSTAIHFAEFQNIIYNKTKENNKIKFSLYVFFEFAIRILKNCGYFEKHEDYIKLKKDMIITLVNNPIISGTDITIPEQISSNSKYNFISSFLQRGDFTTSLACYEYFIKKSFEPISKLNNLLNKKNDTSIHLSNYYQIIAGDIYDVFKSKAKLLYFADVEKTISKYITMYREDFGGIIKMISEMPLKNVISVVFADILFNFVTKLYNISDKFCNKWSLNESKTHIGFFDKINYINNLKNKTNFNEYIKMLMINKLHNISQKRIFDKTNNILTLSEKENDYIKNERKDTKQLKLLTAIDGADLWKDANTENAKKFINKKMNDEIENIKGLFLFNDFKIDISGIKSEYDKLKVMYKGDSYTNAKRFTSLIDSIVQNEDGKENYSILLDNYIILISAAEYLANSSSWYGVMEAMNIFKELKNALLIFDTPIDDEPDVNEEELSMWMHFYARYIMAENGLGDLLYTLSSKTSEFISKINQAYIIASKENIELFEEKLAHHLNADDKALANEFEKLFGVGDKENVK